MHEISQWDMVLLLSKHCNSGALVPFQFVILLGLFVILMECSLFQYRATFSIKPHLRTCDGAWLKQDHDIFSFSFSDFLTSFVL